MIVMLLRCHLHVLMFQNSFCFSSLFSDSMFQSTVQLMLKWFTGNYCAVLRKLGEFPLLPACLFAALHLTALRKLEKL